ncbi:MAG: hypothetical protein M3162_03895, partial [Thermoproteota archaeon]|nr:hypothetical protein [Thermoproteota archaeon]
YQNKEVIIPFTISGTEAIPPGDYVITYIITDNNSGNTFDIVKEVTIASTNSGSADGSNDANNGVLRVSIS